MGLVDRLVKYRRFRVCREILLLLGLEIHQSTTIGDDFKLHHRGLGTVIHPETNIGNHVTIFHQVTIGRADAYRPRERSPMKNIQIDDWAVLCVGSKILGGVGTTRVGRGTVIAANAVLTVSTGEWEIWGGIPARKLGDRPATDRAEVGDDA